MEKFLDIMEMALAGLALAARPELQQVIGALTLIFLFAKFMTRLVIDQTKKSDESRKNGS